MGKDMLKPQYAAVSRLWTLRVGGPLRRFSETCFSKMPIANGAQPPPVPAPSGGFPGLDGSGQVQENGFALHHRHSLGTLGSNYATERPGGKEEGLQPGDLSAILMSEQGGVVATLFRRHLQGVHSGLGVERHGAHECLEPV